MSIRQITKIPLFTAMMVVFTAVIPPIPIAGVPVTLQTLVVMLAGVFLAPVEAFLSMLIYLILGAIGIPVFSGYSGGMGVLLGPTGGFLFAFPFAAMAISWFTRKKQSIAYLVLINCLFGIGFVYLIGIPFFSQFTNMSLWASTVIMAVFIPFDIIKAIIAVFVKEKMNNLSI